MLDYSAAKHWLSTLTALESSLKNISVTASCPADQRHSKSGRRSARLNHTGLSFAGLLGDVWKIIQAAKHVSDVSAAKAQQVFDTPELLEEIISYLDTPGKLEVIEVQRTWHNTILGSTRLQKTLGLVAYHDGFYYSPFSNLFYGSGYGGFTRNDFRWSGSTGNIPDGVYENEDGTFRWDVDEDSEYSWWTTNHEPVTEDPTKLDILFKCSGKPTKMGSCIRSSLIYDPQKMTATAWCDGGCSESNRAYPQRRPEYELSAPTGVGYTIDELYDLVPRIMSMHPRYHCYEVSFHFSMALQESDPVMVHRRRLEQEAEDKRSYRHEKRRR